MHRLLLPFALAAIVFVPEARSQTTIATYFRCATADEGEADFITNNVFAPVYDRHVEAGHILGWGWVEHQAGGAWRRIAVITAADRATAMDMWGKIVEELEEKHPNALHRFNEICGSHDDYVWTQTAASEGLDVSVIPDAWVSTYFVCNAVTESRADELVEQMSQVYDKHVAAGHLGGWAWYTHDIGGRFRRLLTLLSAEGFDLLDARDMVINELLSDHAELFAEFNSVCTGHVDYLWANARSSE